MENCGEMIFQFDSCSYLSYLPSPILQYLKFFFYYLFRMQKEDPKLKESDKKYT